MPNKESAKKALRQSDKRAERNKLAKAELKSLKVKLRKQITAKDLSGASETMTTIGKKLDKAQSKNVMKKGTVARMKSRLTTKVNQAKKQA